MPAIMRRAWGPLAAFAVTGLLNPTVTLAELSSGSKRPELPRFFVDTKYVPPSGRTIVVGKGGDFQAALNRAKPGDVITLTAGARYTGPFTLPNKPGSGWIVVRSSAPEGRLPPPGTRVDPSHADAMPKLVAASGSVISAAPGAHHYRFIGIEIRPGRGGESSKWLEPLRHIGRAVSDGEPAAGDGVFLYNLVSLGEAQGSAERLPHHIIFDRCYIHGDPKRGARRGIAMNSRHTAVVDSYLSDFKEVGADSQAIAGWNGPGPFKIVNNYLEGAGENVMFGGADPSIRNLVPSDIEIRGNHFAKPLLWRAGDPAYAGTPWTVKNLFELKNARRILIDGNLFEYNWPHAQNGFAILFTVRNQDGAAPWSVVRDVTFTNNIVRHVAGGFNIAGRDNNHPSRRTRRILIQNNLFYDVGAPWGRGQLFQLLSGTVDVVIDHNTAFQTNSIVLGGDDEPHMGFVFSNNIAPHNAYGIIGSGTGVGHPSLRRYFPGAAIRNNVIVGGSASQYPKDNFFPRSFADVGFADWTRGDHRLGASSPYKRAAVAGKDAGVDAEAFCKGLLTPRRPSLRLPLCSSP